MFEVLPQLAPDPILGLSAAFKQDTNPNKIDLGVGVYKDEQGNTPILSAVAKAQTILLEREKSKTYITPQGVQGFIDGMLGLILGEKSPVLMADRVAAVQAPGGCGSLRILAELLTRVNKDTRVWISDPTWANHIPLMGNAGLSLETYPYFDKATASIRFDAMMDTLRKVEKGDVVLLHGCCHNPCGADLSQEQWGVIADMAEAQGFVPFIDIAYQGLGDGLEEDAAGLRQLAGRVPEMIIAASCSKNMGLYRERTGCTIFLCADADGAAAVLSQAKVAARRVYSMPPAHGALLAGRVLADAQLTELWQAELGQMCERINGLRSNLVEKLQGATGRDFEFIRKEKGMFSFLGLSKEQVERLRAEHSVYMLGSSRINVAGVNASNIDYLANAIATVL